MAAYINKCYLHESTFHFLKFNITRKILPKLIIFVDSRGEHWVTGDEVGKLTELSALSKAWCLNNVNMLLCLKVNEIYI
jgi:hypothetical protein